MRLRIPRKTTAALGLLLVGALWFFAIWPLCALGPGISCAADSTSPAERVARYWNEVTGAWATLETALCPDEDGRCDELPGEDWTPPEAVTNSFATLSRLLDEVKPAGLVPRIFAEPTTVRLRAGAGTVMSWPSRAGSSGSGNRDREPSSFRIGTVRLVGGEASMLQVLYRRQPPPDADAQPACPAPPDQIIRLGARPQSLGAGAALTFAVPEETGAALVLCCIGADCRLEME